MSDLIEDRLEAAIRHINTAIDVDPWAKGLAIESMRMRIALTKSKQPEIIRCRDCQKCQIDSVFNDYWCDGRKVRENHYCGYAKRRTDA